MRVRILFGNSVAWESTIRWYNLLDFHIKLGDTLIEIFSTHSSGYIELGNFFKYKQNYIFTWTNFL
jgi:hypothetical protein